MDEAAVREELLKAPTSTVTHVHKLLSKIATNPDEPKFRRLKTTSRLFRERFGDAGALLGALGFAADGDLCAREDDGRPRADVAALTAEPDATLCAEFGIDFCLPKPLTADMCARVLCALNSAARHTTHSQGAMVSGCRAPYVARAPAFPRV